MGERVCGMGERVCGMGEMVCGIGERVHCKKWGVTTTPKLGFIELCENYTTFCVKIGHP